MKLLCNRRQSHSGTVTTLRVVWIEIRVEINIVYIHGVTTLRVVWIEISVTLAHSAGKFCPHLGGGVD